MPVLGDELINLGNGATPVVYGFGGNDEVVPKVVNATFDGTSAASSYRPCLIVTGPSGAEIARIPADEVAAGASAEVSWFPRVGGGAPATTGEGIQFTANGVYGPNNVGDKLNVSATVGPTLFDSADFFTFKVTGLSDTVLVLGTDDVLMEAYRNMTLVTDNGRIDMVAGAGRVLVRARGINNPLILRLPVGGSLQVQNDAGATIMRVDENGAGYHIKAGQAWVADL